MKAVPKSSWLYLEEQSEVVERLLEFELIKFDNQRSLPLKKGGTTDVYINLRDARNNPRAIAFVSGLFVEPLRRLGVSRFVEVPDSVSCFAGTLSIATDLPYMTIREDTKTGRVGDAKVIGKPSPKELVCILDDVITDGRSKIIPHQVCVGMGLTNRALVVLVDRQQGWQQLLAKEGIDLPVWAGMTLDDVRRHLIQTLGVMQRCDPAVENSNPIIVALDGMSWEEVLTVIDPLRTTGCILKVNDLLVAKGTEWLIPRLSTYGRVMADLKGHDIPNTVSNIAKHCRQCPPWAVTVHASGGEEMLKGVKHTLEGLPTMVLGVTVLTSLDEEACIAIYNRGTQDEVRRLAAIANDAGVDGLVCSPQEVGFLRKLYPKLMLVTPGIRSVGVSADDQERIGTPAEAIRNGANNVVMGRQILRAANPVAEVQRLLREEIPVRA